jgi:uncharacterized protein YkwD
MKRIFLISLALGLVLFVPRPAVAAVKVTDIAKAINTVRARYHLVQLKTEWRLQTVARTRSANIVVNSSLTHAQPSSLTWKMVRRLGYRFTASGELLAADFSTASLMVAAWMNSPAHRSIILNPRLRDIGVSVARARSGQPFSYAAVVVLGRKTGL